MMRVDTKEFIGLWYYMYISFSVDKWNNQLGHLISNTILYNDNMRGSRGGWGGVGPPPWNLQSFLSPILQEMKN